MHSQFKKISVLYLPLTNTMLYYEGRGEIKGGGEEGGDTTMEEGRKCLHLYLTIKSLFHTIYPLPIPKKRERRREGEERRREEELATTRDTHKHTLGLGM